MHSWTFVAAIPAGILLIVIVRAALRRPYAAAIYAATLLLLFGTSAAYHRLAQLRAGPHASCSGSTTR